MDPRSEVLLRQAQLFDGKLLLAGLPADDLLGQLPQASGWSWHAGEQQRLQRRFAGRCSFGVDAPVGDFEAAVLFLPKSRELTEYLLQTLAARLAGRPLYLVGEKRAGVERAARQLAAFGHARKLDSARHCQLWQVQVEQAPAHPELSALAERFQLELADGPLQVVSLPGVFSHGRLGSRQRPAARTPRRPARERPATGLRLRRRRARSHPERGAIRRASCSCWTWMPSPSRAVV